MDQTLERIVMDGSLDKYVVKVPPFIFSVIILASILYAVVRIYARYEKINGLTFPACLVSQIVFSMILFALSSIPTWRAIILALLANLVLTWLTVTLVVRTTFKKTVAIMLTNAALLAILFFIVGKIGTLV